MIRRLRFPIRGSAIALTAAALTAAAFSGCAGGSADDLDRQNVYGNVTLDGAPLAKGIISFDPAEGSPGTVSAGGVVTDGSYNIDRAHGLTPGKYRVSIKSAGHDDGIDPTAAPGAPPPRKKAAKDPIPAEYNTQSTLTAEVGSGATKVDFDLKSK